MKIKNAFGEIKLGINPDKLTTRPNYSKEILTFKKNAVEGCGLMRKQIEVREIYVPIKEDNFLQSKDIIISLKFPFCAACVEHPRPNIVAPSSFAVLRNIDEEKYDYLFVTHYLDCIILKKDFKKKTLNLKDIEKIELPDIPLDKQTRLHSLLHNIRQRHYYLNAIINNDQIIIETLIKEAAGE